MEHPLSSRTSYRFADPLAGGAHRMGVSSC
ncbi:hypothetical protein VVAX_04142 [Variovorax paradoxus]|uniref:Uncharacterized protein n=1 Tax=Variovorax paradoxus TaxID=34073 RepID=A0A679J1R7_VARPD|nr:hypothetical protein VVAX_04142 [Variovorax paradoxus]